MQNSDLKSIEKRSSTSSTSDNNCQLQAFRRSSRPRVQSDVKLYSPQKKKGTYAKSQGGGNSNPLQESNMSDVDTLTKNLKSCNIEKAGSSKSETKAQNKERFHENEANASIKGVGGTDSPDGNGMRASFHGCVYQIKLIMLFLKRGLDEGYSFRLATEMDAAEKFDDVVFERTDGGNKISTFVQAKHKQDENKKITIDKLLRQKNGEFGLAKYFVSYLKIKDNQDFADSNLKYFILCTNIDFDLDQSTAQNVVKKLKAPRLNSNKGKEISIEVINDDVFLKDDVFFKDDGVRYRFSCNDDMVSMVQEKFKQAVEGEVKNIERLRGQQHQNPKEYFEKDQRWIDEFQRLIKEENNLKESIKKFFAELVFAVNQPSEVKLEKIIRNELGEEFNLINNDFIYSDFLREILDWIKEKKETYFDKRDSEKLFESIKQKIAALMSVGPTSLYRKGLKKLNLTFTDTGADVSHDLKEFLRDCKKQIFNLVTSETLLGAIKVDQTLSNSFCDKYKKNDSHIFTDLHSLSILEGLIEAFKLKITNLLVIECKPQEEDPEELLLKLSQIIRGNDKDEKDIKKKIIFITKKGDVLVTRIKEFFSDEKDFDDKYKEREDKYKEREDKNTSFSDLTPESQEYLKGRRINFQGKNISLGTLITNEGLKELINSETLLKLVEDKKGKEVKIGSEISVFDHIYINRTFNSRVIIKKNAFTDQGDSDIFVVSKATPKYLKKSNTKVKELSEDNPEDHFKLICEGNKEHNVHWLSREPVKRRSVLVHKKSQGSLCRLRENIDLENVENYEREDEFIQRKLAIIAGEPGIGKSFIMERLSRLIKDRNPLVWVVKINLIDYRSELLGVDFNHNTVNEVISFLLKSAQLNTELEKELFKYNLQQQSKIALLLDGFDEVGLVCEEKILSLLKILKDRLWLYISVRSCMKDRLEDSLGIFSHKLNPLQLQDQKKFLQDLFKSANVDEKRVSIFVDKLLESCPAIMDGVFSLDNPLHLEILAKFFEEEFQEFCGNGNEHSTKFDSFNYLDLYEYYVAYKIFIYTERVVGLKLKTDNLRTILGKKNLILGKKLIDNSLESPKEREAISLLTEYKKKFVALFLKELFNDEKYLTQLDLGQNYHTDLREMGVLHSSIYEYHVAKFFVDECLKDPEDRDSRVFKLLEKYYFHPDGKGIKRFFDLIISKDYPMHVDIINGNFDKLRKLLQSKDENERKKSHNTDDQGRTVLHLIAGNVFKEFCSALTQEFRTAKTCIPSVFYYAIISKDKIFNYTPVDYAIKNGDYKVADKILELSDFVNRSDTNYLNEQRIASRKYLLSSLDTDCFTQSDPVLHMAIKKRFFYLSVYLIEILPTHKLTEEDHCGRQPLYYIMCHETTNSWKGKNMFSFISDKIDFNSSDRYGQTGGHFFVIMLLRFEKDEISSSLNGFYQPFYTIVRIMREKRVRMNVLDKDGNPPLHLAIDRLDVIKLLVKKLFVNVNQCRSSDRKSLLHLAVSMVDLEMVKYLCSETADLSQQDSDGNTPLHLAVKGGGKHTEGNNSNVHLEVVELLVKNGANFTIKNNDKCTPKDLASGSVLEYLSGLPLYRESLKEQANSLLRLRIRSFNKLLEAQKALYELLEKLKKQIESVRDAIEGEDAYMYKEKLEDGQGMCVKIVRELREEDPLTKNRGKKLKLFKEVEKVLELHESYNKALKEVEMSYKYLKELPFDYMLQLSEKQTGLQTEFLILGNFDFYYNGLSFKDSELENLHKECQEACKGFNRLKLIGKADWKKMSSFRASMQIRKYQIEDLLNVVEEEVSKKLVLLETSQNHLKGYLEGEISPDDNITSVRSESHQHSKRKADISYYIDNYKKIARIEQYIPTSLPHQYKGIPNTRLVDPHLMNYYFPQCFAQQGTFLPQQYTPSHMVSFGTGLSQQRQQHSSNYISQSSESQLPKATGETNGEPKSSLSGVTVNNQLKRSRL